MSKTLTLLLSCFTLIGTAQNLIPNAGFENYNKEMIERASAAFQFTEGIQDWWSVTSTGSPDWITKNTVWKKKKAIQANPSKCFMGMGSARHHFEYIGTKLKEPLRKGQHYKIVMDIVIPADETGIQLRTDFGFYFTVAKIGGVSKYINEQPQATFENFTPRPGFWTTVTTYFTATEAFKYVQLGEFDPNPQNSYGWKPNASKCYFFIDNIVLEQVGEIPQSFITPPKKEETVVITPPILDTIRLSGVLFEHNKAELTNTTKATLDSHISNLKKSQDTIQIVGHTDNSGKEDYNNWLSQRRAEVVATYLESHGIRTELLEIQGHGSRFPIATNETIEGRQLNRRVEILFKK